MDSSLSLENGADEKIALEIDTYGTHKTADPTYPTYSTQEHNNIIWF